MIRWYFLLVITTASLYSAATSSNAISDPLSIRIFFLIDKANVCLSGKRYDDAIKYLNEGKQVLIDHPELSDDKTSYLYKLLGRYCHKIGRFNDAITHFETYLKKNPDDLNGIDFLTRSLLARCKNSYSALCVASHQINVALMRHPTNRALNLRLGKIHLLLAQARFEKAQKEAPSSEADLKLNKKASAFLASIKLQLQSKKKAL